MSSAERVWIIGIEHQNRLSQFRLPSVTSILKMMRVNILKLTFSILSQQLPWTITSQKSTTKLFRRCGQILYWAPIMYVLVTHNRVIFVLGAIHLQAKLLSVSKTFLLQPDRLCSFYSLSVYWPCDPCLPGPHLRCDKVLISEGVREQRCSILHVALKSHERRSTFGNVINFLSVILESAALPILLSGFAGTLRVDGVGSFSLRPLIFPFLTGWE